MLFYNECSTVLFEDANEIEAVIKGLIQNGIVRLEATFSWYGETGDDRTRLQALSLINDCYKYIMDLTTNGVVIIDAINPVVTEGDIATRTNHPLVEIDTDSIIYSQYEY